MTNTIFDLIETDLPEGKEGFMEAAHRAPTPKDDSYFNTIKDYGKTILKGSVEGINKLGRMAAPLQEHEGIAALKGRKYPTEEEASENLDVLLPTEEGFTQRSLRRGLKEAPTMLAFPGAGAQTLPRSIAAGFAGEGAKDLGLPEWAQSAAELTAYIGPDITKKLLEKGSSKEIIQFGKKMGMSEEQITPLIQSDFKEKWLTKLSSRRGATGTALQNTKKGLDDTYSILQKSEGAERKISRESSDKLIDGLVDHLKEMPRSVQSTIEKDMQDLLNGEITGQSLMNFWKDINANLGRSTKQLSLLKKPVKEAINSISPELGKDFEMVNKLYSKYYPMASKLKPTLTTDLIGAVESIGILGSLSMGYYPPLVKILGERAGKKVAQQLLINPRLQQLSHKMIDAMNANKFGTVKKLTQSFSEQFRKDSPEVSKVLDEITEEEIKELFSK